MRWGEWFSHRWMRWRPGSAKATVERGQMSEMAHSEMAHEPTSNLCPSCAEAGIECIAPKKVPKITVSSLVKPGYRKDIPSEPFFFCQQKECGMVYFGGGGRPNPQGSALGRRVAKRGSGGNPRLLLLRFFGRRHHGRCPPEFTADRSCDHSRQNKGGIVLL